MITVYLYIIYISISIYLYVVVLFVCVYVYIYIGNFKSREVCQVKPFGNQTIVYFYFPNFSSGVKNFVRYESVRHIEAFL